MAEAKEKRWLHHCGHVRDACGSANHQTPYVNCMRPHSALCQFVCTINRFPRRVSCCYWLC